MSDSPLLTGLNLSARSSPGSPSPQASGLRRRLKGQGSFLHVLGISCVLLVAVSLLVMSHVHRHQAGQGPPGRPVGAMEDEADTDMPPDFGSGADPDTDTDTQTGTGTEIDLERGMATDDVAAAAVPINPHADMADTTAATADAEAEGDQVLEQQQEQPKNIMALPHGVDMQPDRTSVYLLLGAPTTLCWRNGPELESGFPATASTTDSRPPVGQAPPGHLCTLHAGVENITAEELLQHAYTIAPCGQHANTPCTPGEVYTMRYTVHAAAQATARYYVPPGPLYRGQLQHSLHFNPLMCGPRLFEYDLLAPEKEQKPQQAPLLSAACELLPGMLQLMGSVAAQGETMDSRWDPTLPDLPGKHNPLLRDRSATDSAQLDPNIAVEQLAAAADAAAESSRYYMVAFALHNSERVMPHYIVQLLALVTYLPPGRVLVSCYESGSTDSTPQWLRFLQGLLDLMQIPNYFVIQGGITRTGERIQFLAAVRNAALAPLYDPDAYAEALDRVGTPHSKRKGNVFPADKIIYLNDPFFSWQDIVRLAHHDKDLVCGMDFQDNYETMPPDVWPMDYDTMRRALRSSGPSKTLSANRLADSWSGMPAAGPGLLHEARRKLRKHPGWHKTTDPLNAFYDVWVARDTIGKPFYWVMPMVHDQQGLRLLMQGLPLPVQCCWNAAAVLNAAPFKPGALPAGTAGAGGPKKDRLQFRSHGDGECAASECSLLCNDLWRVGFRRVMVDPSVRLSYLPYPRNYLHGTVMNGLPALTWHDMQDKLRTQQVQQPGPPREVMCCPIRPVLDYVEWRDCFMDQSWMEPPHMPE